MPLNKNNIDAALQAILAEAAANPPQVGQIETLATEGPTPVAGGAPPPLPGAKMATPTPPPPPAGKAPPPPPGAPTAKPGAQANLYNSPASADRHFNIIKALAAIDPLNTPQAKKALQQFMHEHKNGFNPLSVYAKCTDEAQKQMLAFQLARKILNDNGIFDESNRSEQDIANDIAKINELAPQVKTFLANAQGQDQSVKQLMESIKRNARHPSGITSFNVINEQVTLEAVNKELQADPDFTQRLTTLKTNIAEQNSIAAKTNADLEKIKQDFKAQVTALQNNSIKSKAEKDQDLVNLKNATKASIEQITSRPSYIKLSKLNTEIDAMRTKDSLLDTYSMSQKRLKELEKALKIELAQWDVKIQSVHNAMTKCQGNPSIYQIRIDQYNAKKQQITMDKNRSIQDLRTELSRDRLKFYKLKLQDAEFPKTIKCNPSALERFINDAKFKTKERKERSEVGLIKKIGNEYQLIAPETVDITDKSSSNPVKESETSIQEVPSNKKSETSAQEEPSNSAKKGPPISIQIVDHSGKQREAKLAHPAVAPASKKGSPPPIPNFLFPVELLTESQRNAIVDFAGIDFSIEYHSANDADKPALLQNLFKDAFFTPNSAIDASDLMLVALRVKTRPQSFFNTVESDSTFTFDTALVTGDRLFATDLVLKNDAGEQLTVSPAVETAKNLKSIQDQLQSFGQNWFNDANEKFTVQQSSVNDKLNLLRQSDAGNDKIPKFQQSIDEIISPKNFYQAPLISWLSTTDLPIKEERIAILRQRIVETQVNYIKFGASLDKLAKLANEIDAEQQRVEQALAMQQQAAEPNSTPAQQVQSKLNQAQTQLTQVQANMGALAAKSGVSTQEFERLRQECEGLHREVDNLKALLETAKKIDPNGPTPADIDAIRTQLEQERAKAQAADAARQAAEDALDQTRQQMLVASKPDHIQLVSLEQMYMQANGNMKNFVEQYLESNPNGSIDPLLGLIKAQPTNRANRSKSNAEQRLVRQYFNEKKSAPKFGN